MPQPTANQAAASWPQAKFHTSQGLGHRRILHDSEIHKIIGDFLAAEEGKAA